MYKTVNGDLIEMAKAGKFDAIVQGCNCFHRMGSGIAKQIAREFPNAVKVDKELTKYGDYLKLGKTSIAECPTENGSVMVFNAYTQFKYGQSDGQYDLNVHVDYNAIYRVFSEINKNYNGLKIGFPMIGAGLANGNWDIISDIIVNVVGDGTNDWTLVKFVNQWSSIHE